jgi:hypothetical protein
MVSPLSRIILSSPCFLCCRDLLRGISEVLKTVLRLVTLSHGNVEQISSSFDGLFRTTLFLLDHTLINKKQVKTTSSLSLLTVAFYTVLASVMGSANSLATHTSPQAVACEHGSFLLRTILRTGSSIQSRDIFKS